MSRASGEMDAPESSVPKAFKRVVAAEKSLTVPKTSEAAATTGKPSGPSWSAKAYAASRTDQHARVWTGGRWLMQAAAALERHERTEPEASATVSASETQSGTTEPEYRCAISRSEGPGGGPAAEAAGLGWADEDAEVASSEMPGALAGTEERLRDGRAAIGSNDRIEHTHTTRGARVRRVRVRVRPVSPRGLEPVCPPKGRACERVGWPALAVRQSRGHVIETAHALVGTHARGGSGIRPASPHAGSGRSARPEGGLASGSGWPAPAVGQSGPGVVVASEGGLSTRGDSSTRFTSQT